MNVDDPLVTHMLRNSSVMRLATMSAAGHTTLTPLWFVVDAGRIVAGTAASTVAVRNIRADPRVTLLLDGETAGPSERVLRVRGFAEINEGMPPGRAVVRLRPSTTSHQEDFGVSCATSGDGGYGSATTPSPTPFGSRSDRPTRNSWHCHPLADPVQVFGGSGRTVP